jgi:hypothetical protein
VLLAAVAAPASGQARTVPRPQTFAVWIVDGLTIHDLEAIGRRGAVGLLEPAAGPRTNRRRALAALLRGAVRNARLGGVPAGRPVIEAHRGSGLPTGHPVIVLSLPPAGKPVLNDRRYPIAIIGRGYHGLLTSPTTRIPGLVSIVDVAPTVLERPGSAMGSTGSADPDAVLGRLDRTIASNNRVKLPALFVVAGCTALLALLGGSLGLAALVAALGGSLALGALGVTDGARLLVCLALSTLLGGALLGRLLRSSRALLAGVVAVCALYALAMVYAPAWAAINPLGPTQNSRFFGIGNQVETLLLAPLIASAAFAGRRYGIAGFALLAGLALVGVADNRLGADGGGAVVLGVVFSVLVARLARLRWIGLATSLLVSAAAVLGLVWFDLRIGGPNHLRSAFGHGITGLADVARNRIPLAYEPALAQWYLTGPTALAFVVISVLSLRGDHPAGRRSALVALIAGVATSLLVNDSAGYVLVGGCSAIVALRACPHAFGPLRRLAPAPARPIVEAAPARGTLLD